MVPWNNVAKWERPAVDKADQVQPLRFISRTQHPLSVATRSMMFGVMVEDCSVSLDVIHDGDATRRACLGRK
jgi:hypothetical protein